MIENATFVRFLAAWALVHETADEGWKAAVVRGEAQEAGGMSGGPEAFVDGLSAVIAEEKERLKAELAAGKVEEPGSMTDVSNLLENLSFEIAELRGRIESMQTSLDSLADARDAQSGSRPGGGSRSGGGDSQPQN